MAYWPYVNVAFGAFYVRQWLSHFDGSVFAALAAYNARTGQRGRMVGSWRRTTTTCLPA